MKNLVKIFTTICIVAVVVALSVSTNNAAQADESDVASVQISYELLDNCCCPPGWALLYIDQALYPDDPALKWDINGDSYVCFKGPWIIGDTPKGNGNDPLYTQSNVKDNNNPCKYEEGPCTD